jgi:hypothetical protein
LSFDTRLAQNAIAEPPGIFLGVNRNPDFLAGCGMLQQSVTAFPGPDLDESRSLQLPDHLGPGHLEIVNLPLGFVNAANDRPVRYVSKTPKTPNGVFGVSGVFGGNLCVVGGKPIGGHRPAAPLKTRAV